MRIFAWWCQKCFNWDSVHNCAVNMTIIIQSFDIYFSFANNIIVLFFQWIFYLFTENADSPHTDKASTEVRLSLKSEECNNNWDVPTKQYFIDYDHILLLTMCHIMVDNVTHCCWQCDTFLLTMWIMWHNVKYIQEIY